MDIISVNELDEWTNILDFYKIPYSLNKLTKHKIIFYHMDISNIKASSNKINLVYKSKVPGFKTINNVVELVAFYHIITSNEYFIESEEVVIDSMVKDIAAEITLYYKFIDLDFPKNKNKKTVHFIFEPIKYSSMPEKWKTNINTCSRFHDVKVHSLNNLESKLDLYPEFKETYAKLDFWICKMDFLRLLLIYDEGGIYSDLDIEYYNPVPDFVDNLVLIKDTYNGQINNCFIIAEKRNNIIYEIMQDIVKRANRNTLVNNKLEFVLSTTGPKVVTDIIKKYQPDLSSENVITNIAHSFKILPKFCTIKHPVLFHKFQIFCHEQDGSWLEITEKHYSYGLFS